MDILSKIRPSRKEKLLVQKTTKEFLKKLSYIKGVTFIIGGSISKDTWLKGTNEVDIFAKFTNQYTIDKFGNHVVLDGKRVINKDAIFNAWETPMIIVSSQNQIEPRGYSKVRELKIEKGDSKISTLVDKSEQLTREKLDENNIDYSIIELLANKLFCDWINFRE